MNNALDAFLSADLNKTTNVAIPRLGIHLKVRALTTEEITRLTERATYGDTLDEKKLGGLIINLAVTNVDFGDKRMLEKYGAPTPEACVLKALFAGEVATVTEAIMEASGFGNLNDKVKQAKN